MWESKIVLHLAVHLVLIMYHLMAHHLDLMIRIQLVHYLVLMMDHLTVLHLVQKMVYY